MIKLIAHRAGAALRPENTMAAILHALERRVDGLEIDVHLCADGRLVVHHDYRLNPMATRTDGHWLTPGSAPLIKDLTWEELCRYDVGRLRPGSALAAKHPRQRPVDGEVIPLLTDILALVEATPDTLLQIEVKHDAYRPELSAPPDAIVEAVVRTLEASPLLPRLWVIAFDWGLLVRLKERIPGLQTGFLTDRTYSLSDDRGAPDSAPWAGGFDPNRFGGSYPAAIAAAGGTAWGPNFRDLTAETAAEARRLGLQLAVWTVNGADDLRRMDAWGVAMAASDDPWSLADAGNGKG